MDETRSLKRPRGSFPSHEDESAGEAMARGPLCFDQFLALPEELRSQILDLAYHLPLSRPPGTMTMRSTLPVDMQATLSLATTCRWLYMRTAFFLYRDIKVLRPSVLVSLQRAVASHPQLGRLIKRLHVGPDSELLDDKTPPVTVQPSHWDAGGKYHDREHLITSSLRSADDVKVLPQWCPPGRQWLHKYRGPDGKAMAISRALVALEESLGFTIGLVSTWQPNTTILQLYEMQAALDLYLIELRRFDDERKSGCAPSISASTDKAEYPALVLIGTKAQPALPHNRTPEEHYVITRSQVLRHLARPGCATDSFDHRLLFARSGFHLADETSRRNFKREESNETRWGPEDAADTFTPSGDVAEPTTGWRDSLQFLDPVMINASTAGSLLALLRSLLSLSPRLETLSLTGFLERAVCGQRPAAALLQSLRSLSVGPPPSLRTWVMPLNFEGMGNLREIRICGVMLRGDEAFKVGRRWQSFQWTMPDELSGQGLLRLGVIIDYLVRRKGVAADKALRELGFDELDMLKLPFSYSATEEDPPEDEKETGDYRFTNLVHVKLHPKVLHAMLDRASCDGERLDWLKGHGRHNQTRRLMLSEIVPTGGKGTVGGESMRQAMYDDGQLWWETQPKPKVSRETRFRSF